MSIVRLGVLVGCYAGQSGFQVGLLEDVGLVLEVSGREDEMLRNDGEFVQDYEVRGSYVGDSQGGRRVGEGVEGFGGGGCRWWGSFWFIGQCW